METSTLVVPAGVLAAYGWDGAAVEGMTGGLINATFLVRPAGRPPAVLQRLHHIFGAEVNLDLDAVTRHIAARGLETPRLIPTRGGDGWVVEPGATRDEIWRAITFVDGESFARVPTPEHARSAGELVGRFHQALADLDRPFAFTRAGVHDTDGHLRRLAAGAAAPAITGEAPELAPARALAAELAAHAADLVPLGAPSLRPAHGDLKISNLLFARGAPRAVCLVDLDTLGRMLLVHEVGDALRSWCNPLGEDVEVAAFDRARFAAAVAGYGATAGALLTPEERATIVAGWETVCLEVAVRFCADVFEDRYFGWDPSRFPSRRAHNLVRARGQASLAASVRAARAEVTAIAAAALGAPH